MTNALLSIPQNIQDSQAGWVHQNFEEFCLLLENFHSNPFFVFGLLNMIIGYISGLSTMSFVTISDDKLD